jgi:hypothetical protein
MSGFGSEFYNGVTEDGCSYGSASRDDPDTAGCNSEEVRQNTNVSFSEYVEGMQDNT